MQKRIAIVLFVLLVTSMSLNYYYMYKYDKFRDEAITYIELVDTFNYQCEIEKNECSLLLEQCRADLSYYKQLTIERNEDGSNN